MADPVVAVVGAGPAGVRAAETLARAGVRPILLDEAERPGGQIYRQPPPEAARSARLIYGFEAAKAQSIHRVPSELGGRIDYRPGTLVWNLFQGRLDLLGPEGYGAQAFDRVVLATGAMDRALPFPGWTLPGVFALGGAQIALKAQGVTIGRRVAFVGAGPLLPLVAHQYAKAGAEVIAVLDMTPFPAKLRELPGLAATPATLAKGLWYTARNRLHGLKIRYGVRALRAEGADRVEALSYRDGAGREHRVACDAIGASFGLRSETQLAALAGCAFVFDPVERQWRPKRTPEGRSSVPGVYLAGDGAGIGGADLAELQGRRTALALLEDLGRPVDSVEVARLDAALARQARFRRALEAAYPFPAHLLDDIGDDEIVCRCEGVTARILREAATGKEVGEMNRLKAFTRIGMGRCQGRMCGLAAAELLARARGVPVEEVGYLRCQPPVKPIPVLGSGP
ncbi:MAG TPA: NAD(P)/FAD-dependent oxidoreductase [Beijerinckiaceae bacterium]|jgi:NADPH-dependent 2,4-dienoyl-CoA reductase/sulfur reductase-like enzyme